MMILFISCLKRYPQTLFAAFLQVTMLIMSPSFNFCLEMGDHLKSL